MQTAAIPYRVADFLKQYPPFQFFGEAELISLAAHGRVKFHDVDEYICWQGSAYTPFLYVIQQGSVSLWDETADPPVLSDMLGVGDIIGMERFNGVTASPHSAKAASEVMLYALNAADFEALLPRSPEAAQFVASYSAVTSEYHAPGQRPQPHEIYVADLIRDRSPVQCSASASILEAARLFQDSGAQALPLIDVELMGVESTAGESLAAIVTSSDLIAWIASGALHPEQPVRNIVSAGVLLTIAPRLLVSDCVLAMAKSVTGTAALTSDATPDTPLQTIITESSLAPAFGDHPVTILREISIAPRLESLRALNERARALILDHLTEPSALDWLAAWADLVNCRILERVLHLTGIVDKDSLICFHGAAGRQELLTRPAPRLAVIGSAPAQLETALAESGYLSPKPVDTATLTEWKARFSGWIRDPIRNQVYESRPYFDLRPIHGPVELFAQLEAHIRAELAAEPGFIRLLAHDCLSTFPPLTFFRDLVVEESGEQTDVFRLEAAALRPLVDVARVFALAAGGHLGESTIERFQRARRLLPAQERIFRDAADTMRVMLYHQARAGLRFGSNGAEIPLSVLSRQDRQVLKNGFRSIHALLEFTAPCDWLEAL